MDHTHAGEEEEEVEEAKAPERVKAMFIYSPESPSAPFPPGAQTPFAF